MVCRYGGRFGYFRSKTAKFWHRKRRRCSRVGVLLHVAKLLFQQSATGSLLQAPVYQHLQPGRPGNMWDNSSEQQNESLLSGWVVDFFVALVCTSFTRSLNLHNMVTYFAVSRSSRYDICLLCFSALHTACCWVRRYTSFCNKNADERNIVEDNWRNNAELQNYVIKSATRSHKASVCQHLQPDRRTPWSDDVLWADAYD